MASTEELQARLDALEEARDAGVLRIRKDDQDVWYRSATEMDATIARLRRQINGSTARRLITFSKGTS